MTQEALIRRLQISCLGLDPIDPLRLLVDDVIEALRENAMREVQRLGQEIEQKPVAYINVKKRRLEFTEPMVWHTPTVVNLERIPLYTHQRTWVGMTDDEIEEIWENNDTNWESIKKVEAKLKQLNT